MTWDTVHWILSQVHFDTLPKKQEQETFSKMNNCRMSIFFK